MKRTTTVRQPRPRRAGRKPKPIVYGAAWVAWIKRNVVRNLHSGALRVNAKGMTLHGGKINAAALEKARLVR